MKHLIRIVALVATLATVPVARAQSDSKDAARPQPTTTPPPTGAPQFHARPTGQVTIGEIAPDFELDGSNGKPVKLSALRGRWALLVFADRKESLAPYARQMSVLDSAGVRLVTVCAEKSYVLEQYAKRDKVPFLMLADFSREISEMYGVYNSVENTVQPGYLVLNPKGEVALMVLGHDLPAFEITRLATYVAGMN